MLQRISYEVTTELTHQYTSALQRIKGYDIILEWIILVK